MSTPHYFVTPAGQERRRVIRARFWDEDWEFDTADGIFSAGRLDLGTSVLLRESTPPTGEARLLDLGCGFGAITIALAVGNPKATVDAVDVNLRALDLTRANAERHGVAQRVQTFTPDEANPGVKYDEIWSNPPIRIGKEALHELLLTWLPRLKPNGAARLVVGKNLGADSLQAWLNANGWDCRRTASAKGFRVLEVRHPHQTPHAD
ncbi:MAG: methyltransferase [Propionibacteriaceae bacterium]|jgi:16S rRNA G1207 methylase RsmC|nr:methyltransferase [Propionibacteriaceae bacterium]